MKIRNGFVSNSSTTSFCIYGIHIKNLSDGFITNCLNLRQEDLLYGYEGVDLQDELICYLDVSYEKRDGSFWEREDYHDVYIGFTPTRMSIWEKLSEFECRIRDVIIKNYPTIKNLINNIEFQFHYGEVSNQ